MSNLQVKIILNNINIPEDKEIKKYYLLTGLVYLRLLLVMLLKNLKKKHMVLTKTTHGAISIAKINRTRKDA